MRSSRVYIGPSNPILRRKKIPKRFGQCISSRIFISGAHLTIGYGEMSKLMNSHYEEVRNWLEPRIPVDEDKMDTS